MKVREALRAHEERTQLIRDDLVPLHDFPVAVLPAVSAEYLNLAKDNPGKRLQFLAKSSRLGFALKAATIMFGLARGLLRMRSQKMQAALTKWSLLLYYSVFRATAFIR
jgi:hypothetical protein